MKTLIFSNMLPQYSSEHLRCVTVDDSEDSAATAARYMLKDVTLSGQFLGVFPILIDRRWRNEWRISGGVCGPDVNLCRLKRLSEIRTERDGRIQASDREMMKRLDVGTSGHIAEYRAYRQQLRDLPAIVFTQMSGLMTPTAISEYVPPWSVEP